MSVANPIQGYVLGRFNFASRAADATAIQSDDTLANDTDLFIPLETNSRYVFTATIAYESAANADLKNTLTVPSGSSGGFTELAVSGTTLTAFASVEVADGNANDMLYNLTGFVITGSTAGNLQYQWAQNTEQASDTKTLAGSSISAWKTS